MNAGTRARPSHHHRHPVGAGQRRIRRGGRRRHSLATQPINLEVLGAALRLDELTAVATEHHVLGKRLDILARALDADEEIPV